MTERDAIEVLAEIADYIESSRTSVTDALTLREARAQLAKEREAADAVVNWARRAIAHGLNEEPHGIGFTPSRAERVASEIVVAMEQALATYAAARGK